MSCHSVSRKVFMYVLQERLSVCVSRKSEIQGLHDTLPALFRAADSSSKPEHGDWRKEGDCYDPGCIQTWITVHLQQETTLFYHSCIMAKHNKTGPHFPSFSKRSLERIHSSVFQERLRRWEGERSAQRMDLNGHSLSYLILKSHFPSLAPFGSAFQSPFFRLLQLCIVYAKHLQWLTISWCLLLIRSLVCYFFFPLKASFSTLALK